MNCMKTKISKFGVPVPCNYGLGYDRQAIILCVKSYPSHLDLNHRGE